MAGTTVGRIDLELGLNSKEFESGFSGLMGKAKSLGKLLAGAFAIKQLASFGASCIALGSDLAEVQNVVDVTFTSMSKQANAFAKSAAASFGLSETMAKQFMGTTGAMAKAFGFSEEQAFGMSSAITGLAGDVASFYNISQDEAYTKLKSIFTGETESLKGLGIVMTQTALDAFSLANGFGKTTSQMSEQEKVALRYKFVMDQLSLASGDFVRTSDGWANQVRLLKLQFDSLKASIGQGLIAVLSPVIKVINAIIGRILSLVNAFKAFTSMFGGKSTTDGGIKSATSGLTDMASSAEDASGAISDTGSSAKKATKDIASATTGIDELNIISADTASESGAGGSGGSGSGGVSDFDFGTFSQGEPQVDTMSDKVLALIDRLKELQGIFLKGFKIGLGDTSVLEDIKGSVLSIRDSFMNIFTDASVVSVANNWMNTIALSLGKSIGAFASIGLTIVSNFLGGVSKYFEQNSEFLKNTIVRLFDISGKTSELNANFMVALADVFSIFRSDSAQQITADIIAIFTNSFLSITTLIAQYSLDIGNLIAQPFIDNSTKIKETLGVLIDTISENMTTIKNTVDYALQAVFEMYDKHVKPFIDSIASGLSYLTGVYLEAFNTYILPVIESIAPKLGDLATNYIQPLIDKVVEFTGKFSEGLTLLWESVLVPFIEWFMLNVAPIIGEGLQAVIDIFFMLAECVAQVIGGVIDALGGLIDFVIGVFTGDWKRAWQGIKTFVGSIWDIIKSIISTAIEVVKTVIDAALAIISSIWTSIWEAIKTKVSEIWEAIKTTITTLIEIIKKGIEEKITAIKTIWCEIWDAVKQKVEDVWNGIWSTIKGVINSIIGGVESMVNSVVKAINGLIDGVNDLADKVPGIDVDLIPKLDEVSLPRLAQGGYVRANTPQLAIIGDNKTQGEIVAPEGKLLEMAKIASENGGNSEGMERMATLLEVLIDVVSGMDLTLNLDVREMTDAQNQLKKRLGYTLT